MLADGIPNLLEKIYLDENHPENNNVKLQRIKKPSKMLVYEQQPENQEAIWVCKDLDKTLDTMIEKGSDILIKHNNHIFRISKDVDVYDHRSETLSSVRTKKRGVYGKIKNGVLCKVENKRKKTTNKKNENVFS
jgi:hypothetical protein